MDVGSFFVSETQTAKLTKPGEGSLNHPPPSAQATPVLGISLGNPRRNPADSQASPDRFGIVTTVAYHTIRAISRPSQFSLQEWDGINKRERLLRIVTIGCSELNSQRNSVPVANQMTLTATLSPVGRIRTCPLPPKTARTEQLSTTARDQSIRLKRQSQSNNAK